MTRDIERYYCSVCRKMATTQRIYEPPSVGGEDFWICSPCAYKAHVQISDHEASREMPPCTPMRTAIVASETDLNDNEGYSIANIETEANAGYSRFYLEGWEHFGYHKSPEYWLCDAERRVTKHGYWRPRPTDQCSGGEGRERMWW
jgi:hypothetical protein